MVVYLKRAGGQSQFSAPLVAQITEKSPIQSIVQYILENLTADLTIDALAERTRMSTRNFARVFTRELNMTPADFVEAARLDSARRYLQDGEMPLQRIAQRCGFGGLHGLRRAFRRKIGIGPSDYRNAFRTSVRTEKQFRPLSRAELAVTDH